MNLMTVLRSCVKNVTFYPNLRVLFVLMVTRILQKTKGSFTPRAITKDNSTSHHVRWILIDCQCFYHPSAEKTNHCESDSIDIISLCHYRNSCGVDAIILHFE